MSDEMSNDYLWDRSGAPDAEVEQLEKLLSPLAHDAPLDALRMRRRRPWIVGGALVAAAAAVAIYVALPDPRPACSGHDGFAFTGVGGAVSCGGASVASGVLPVGGELDTGAHEATLTIADIGKAHLGTGTQVRLERTDSTRHQLALERGRMHARVVAPPRLFAVTTKHADVIDLGCEYDIAIDDSGAGSLHVISGLVELATKSGALVTVAEGCDAKIVTGNRPGLPICEATTPAVRTAAQAYDAGDAAAFDALLAAAQRQDAITLLALAAVDDARRKVALERLAELSPPPDAEIDVDSALINPDHLATWRTDILEIYFGLWAPRRTP
jgi:ferric-dicitrate binding protein FerR (iron transport regulator)